MSRNLQIVWTMAAALLCVAVAGTQAFAQFETRASASVGADQPISVVVGDFNRDGKLDVAVVSDTPTGNVSIFLGNGDGTFRAGASYAVAVQPFYAAAASFRHNGILDLVVGDSLSDDVYVMLGNGDGTFQPAIAYPTTGRPAEVSTGDFTGGGKVDIIALAGIGCYCVEVLPSNGDGTFGAAIDTPVPYNIGGFGIASGDFDGDGKLDVAVSGFFGSANQVDILLGNGDGSFRADGFYPVSLAPLSVVAGHFNADKKVDLAVGNLEGNSISVLLGNGNGTFLQAVDYDTGGYTTWVAAGDLNGDGKEDLVAANSGSPSNPFVGSVSVLMGNGDGTFQPGVAYPAGENLNYVVIGDFNGDHKPDLVAVDTVGAVITLLNTGVVAFSPTTPLTFPTQLLGTTSAPLTATLTNTGTSALTISSVSYSGKPFKVQTTCKGSIAPGGNCSITATFTAQVAGVVTGTVTIKDSASTKPQVVELVGTGTEVKFTPTQLTFPPQKKGTKSPPQHFRLTNIGSTAFDFTYKIYISGTGYQDFFESNNCPTSLNAGASCTINVTFAPRVTGSISGAVVFTDTGGGSPQLVLLSGTGD
jgi:FG-GAP-like repeat/Abnormal spindle-like microcephaly-assoc'd, ASPM-SPD-2-Hydin